MVTVKLQGRLGNQMFQIGTAQAYAILYNQSCYIPPQSERPADWPCYFSHLTSSPPQANHCFDYKEAANGSFQEIPYYPNICLDGYFNSEKYFATCRQPIVKLFNIPWQKRTGYVSIHVRRGDYLNHPEKHPVVSEDYIIQALKYFIIEKGLKKFLFFSDDISWCKKFVDCYPFLTAGIPKVGFSYSEGKTELEDMALMSQCEHHIISNSSFSWWGAWLNQNPNKIVIAPKQWTKAPPSEWDTKDIVPETWIRM